MSDAGRLGVDRARVAAAYAAALLVALAVGWSLARGAAAATASAGWTTHPIAVAATADLAATLVVFAFSFALDNSSVYDPYWSLAPIPIAVFWGLGGAGAIAAVAPAVVTPAGGARGAVVTLLIVVWGGRLTANWVHRWKGLADEDWRYQEYRGSGVGRYWAISLAGFHLLPTVIVFLGCVPVYFVLTAGARPVGPLDALGLAVAGSGVWLESAADRELRRFHANEPFEGALLTSGPWAWCRHPNYLGELLFWWGLALAGLAASPGNAVWSLAGAVAISTLFSAVSLPLMERRLANKPGFAEYARRTPLLVPRRPARLESGA